MSRLSVLLLAAAAGVATAASSGDSVRMQLAGWQLDASKITASYQPAHVIVLGAVLVQGADTIRADRAEASALEVRDATWLLSGNVQVQVPQGELASDSATIAFKDGKVVLATAHGQPATFTQRAVAASPPASGHAQDISFDVPKGEVRLVGDAWVTRDHNDLSACQIIYNLTQQTVDAQKCEDAAQGVHGTLQLKPAAPASGAHP